MSRILATTTTEKKPQKIEIFFNSNQNQKLMSTTKMDFVIDSKFVEVIRVFIRKINIILTKSLTTHFRVLHFR